MTKSIAIPGYKVFFMFMMFMWVASVCPLTGFNFGKNPILMPIYLLILLFYFVSYCKYNFRPLLAIIAIFFIWYLLSCIKYGGIQGFQFQPIYSIIIAHIAFNIYSKEEFICLFERFLVFFCFLSLFVWFLASFFPSIFMPFFHGVSIIKSQPPTETYSFLFGVCSHIEMGIRRNIGFTWEPGKFSCWILLGMYFNLIVHKFDISFKENKSMWILLLTLLTTLSTTGYALLSIIILFYLLNKKGSSKIIVIFLVLILVPFILELSFMQEKILLTLDISNDEYSINESAQVGADIKTPQRFAGFYFETLNFINDFWLGYNQNELSYTTNILFGGQIQVVNSNGIVYILAKYGVLVGLFFYYWLIKSSALLASSLKYKGKYFFALLFILLSFSYDFWENCILMFFYLSAFYRLHSPNYFREDPGLRGVS